MKNIPCCQSYRYGFCASVAGQTALYFQSAAVVSRRNATPAQSAAPWWQF